jgi:shikimate dehydrogenase
MRRAFVAGWPVEHSRSPLIHRFWLARYRLEGDYVREAVPPAEAAGFLCSLEERGYIGGNVTVPHKEAAFAACATLTAVARRLGAVNTVWLDDGALCGDNTDAFGFAANLDEGVPEWRGASNVLVLGAGGASRAVLDAVVEGGLGFVTVVNRTVERATAVAALFQGRVAAEPWDALPQLLPHADLIVNATSAGMAGQAEFAIDWTAARRDAVATDLVYVPRITPFLAGAAERGLTVVDGLGMLLHQAAPGFERWFGVRPVVDAELRSLVLADLAS